MAAIFNCLQQHAQGPAAAYFWQLSRCDRGTDFSVASIVRWTFGETQTRVIVYLVVLIISTS